MPTTPFISCEARATDGTAAASARVIKVLGAKNKLLVSTSFTGGLYCALIVGVLTDVSIESTSRNDCSMPTRGNIHPY